jgi:hypothetical protein
MNNTIDSKELQEMKEQLELLNQKLEHETIVNQCHIRKSMKGKSNHVHLFLICKIIASIFCILLCVLIGLCSSDFPMLICAACTIFFVSEIVYNCYIFSHISSFNFAEDNLTVVYNENLNFEQLSFKWTYWFNLPIAFVILLLLIYERSPSYECFNWDIAFDLTDLAIYGGAAVVYILFSSLLKK